MGLPIWKGLPCALTSPGSACPSLSCCCRIGRYGPWRKWCRRSRSTRVRLSVGWSALLGHLPWAGGPWASGLGEHHAEPCCGAWASRAQSAAVTHQDSAVLWGTESPECGHAIKSVEDHSPLRSLRGMRLGGGGLLRVRASRFKVPGEAKRQFSGGPLEFSRGSFSKWP